MNTAMRDSANSAPLVFLALGSALILGALAGAGYCLVQAWRIEAAAIGWLAAAFAFGLVAAAVAPMMIGLGYGTTEVRRLLRFYATPVRVVHLRHNRKIVLPPPGQNDEDDLAA